MNKPKRTQLEIRTTRLTKLGFKADGKYFVNGRVSVSESDVINLGISEFDKMMNNVESEVRLQKWRDEDRARENAKWIALVGTDIFTRKSKEELEKLPYHRIKEYWRSELIRYERNIPWCCEFHCETMYTCDEHKQVLKRWADYVNFVKAIMLTKKEELKTVVVKTKPKTNKRKRG